MVGVPVEDDDDAATPLVDVPVEDDDDDAAVDSCSDARVVFVVFTCRVADIDTGVAAAAAPDDVVALLE